MENNHNSMINPDLWQQWHSEGALWEKLKPLARQQRHEPTEAEEKLWDCLRGRKVANAKFRRQHTIERFIVDLICFQANLVIEIDGEYHTYTQAEDRIRQEFLENLGLKVIRFTNDQVMYEIEQVIEQIENSLRSH